MPPPSEKDAPANKPAPSLVRIRQFILFIAFLCAIVQLLITQAGPDAPIWQSRSATWPQHQMEALFSNVDLIFQEAADDGNLALHFDLPPTLNSNQETMASQLYFRSVYALYPRRVFIGKNDRVINSAADLLAADTVPDDTWLAAHDVKSVLIMHESPSGGSAWEIRRVH